ncbi:Probable porphobilinogen deaminase [Geodia barretti]|uniref:hydroxymethylbilane synthase n=1 Tax=Geodia barretti TaxID=519541 RepID=A0AA35SEY4_GEOBA|nr:Probable porphobilinogen deaminase [Geodia barretti]
MAQTRWVADRLAESDPGATFQIQSIRTTGDGDPRPLFAMDQKGIFEREVDAAVAQSRVDFAVHSLKDVPSQLPDGLTLACVPKRESARDVLITGDGSSLQSLPRGSIIGTSSLRRAVQIRRSRPDVGVRPIRGNIETRIAKIDGANYHGIVLAQAGISRLNLDVISAALPEDEFVPSPGQGSLAVVSRADDHGLITLLKGIEDADSRLEAEAERALSGYVESGCRFPLGAHASVDGPTMTLRAAAFSADGKKSAVARIAGDRRAPRDLADRTAQDLRRQGVEALASGWRESLEMWNR